MTQNRAYSLMKIKAVNEDARTITGIASTVSPDRYGDVVEPSGAKFTLPLPLLWQHDMLQPIGSITKARVTDEGIEITAQVAAPDPAAPSQMAARLQEAWASIKSGLVRGLSIGFRPIEYAFIEGGGTHFTQWDLFEVSAVTVPANAECSIQTIKSLCAGERAALGTSAPAKSVSKKTLAGVSAKSTLKGNSMNVAEQIKAFETKRATLAAEREAIMGKSFDEGRTLDIEETEKYDEVSGEIKSVDSHLARLRDMEANQAKSAKPVATVVDGQLKSVNAPAVIKVEQKLEKGIAFARFAKSLAAAQGSRSEALAVAKHQYPDDAKLHHVLKAAVNAGTTTDAAWAGSLVEYQEFAQDFIEYLRPQTIIGKFGTNGIPSLHRVPFKVRIPTQTNGGGAGWVGEGQAKPITTMAFSSITFDYAKIASIAVLTDELVRFSNPSADALVRNSLAGAIVQKLDEDFVTPSVAAIPGVSPASITNGAGVKKIATSGDADVDAGRAFAVFVTNNLTPVNGVWLMSATNALALSLQRTPMNAKVYPELTMLGGTFHGLPVIVSNSVGDNLILVNASDIYLADDGQVVIDASREASLEMVDPTTHYSGDRDYTTAKAGSPAVAGKSKGATSMVSMFQTNSVAIRAERWINWQRRRDEAVVVISGADYGVGSPVVSNSGGSIKP